MAVLKGGTYAKKGKETSHRNPKEGHMQKKAREHPTEIYWEHFGKMDLPEYAKNAADKLHMYARNGIYPGDRLITTYETMEQPLDTAIVQKLITYHFK